MRNLVLCLTFAISCGVAAAKHPVHVKASTTKTGEHRQPHYRTSPDHTQRNNYSAKGNVNPYTGKTGTKTPKH